MSEPEPFYLGDGVYVSVERGMLKLSTHDIVRELVIYLEPEVWAALVRYVRRHGAAEMFVQLARESLQ